MTGTIVGPFRIMEKLGEGGMGVVYKAEDTVLNRTVALKFLSDAARLNQEMEKRFTREAQAAARLDHPAICAVHGYHQEAGHRFIVMAYVKGKSLHEWITSGQLTLALALDYTIGIAEGLKAAHAKGVVHRDIKPANIIVSDSGQPILTDFGLALLTDRSRITRANTIMGTVRYMSPEQALGKDVDRRTDIWSLAVVLYELLCGQAPFTGKNHSAVLSALIHNAPPALSELPHPTAEELNRILAKALSKNPGMRYQHMDDFAVDLAAVRRRCEGAQLLPARGACANDATTLTSIDQPTAFPRVAFDYRWLVFATALLLIAGLLWRFVVR
ncbi:MAG: serine/threonine protein kinase [Acidimicrobiia bacterium]|nr:serine/threonine protein kinase [Acidimicrobiia bacterium]